MARGYVETKLRIPASAKDPYSVRAHASPTAEDYSRGWSYLAVRVPLAEARRIAREAMGAGQFGVVRIARLGTTARTSGDVYAYTRTLRGPQGSAWDDLYTRTFGR